MSDDVSKKAIVVLGPGGSGAGFLMNVLHQAGMRLSGIGAAAASDTPVGDYEDVDLDAVYKELLEDLHLNPALPLPKGWLDDPATRYAAAELKTILTERTAAQDTLWGFWHPLTAPLLPLWVRVFDETEITPVFLLALRNPENSLDASAAELQWLHRAVNSVKRTAAECFIVHYEDWFSQPEELARALADYTGLAANGRIDETVTALPELIESNLSQSGAKSREIKNQEVLNFYQALQKCRFGRFNREELLRAAEQGLATINEYRGWWEQAQTSARAAAALAGDKDEIASALDKVRSRQKKLEAGFVQFKKASDKDRVTLLKVVNKTEAQLKQSEGELKKALARVSELESRLDEVTRLYNDVAVKLDKAACQNIELQHSFAYRLGSLLRDAALFRRRGKASILLPYYLVLLLYDFYSGFGRVECIKAIEQYRESNPYSKTANQVPGAQGETGGAKENALEHPDADAQAALLHFLGEQKILQAEIERIRLYWDQDRLTLEKIKEMVERESSSPQSSVKTEVEKMLKQAEAREYEIQAEVQIKDMRSDLEKLVLMNHELILGNRKFFDQVENLRQQAAIAAIESRAAGKGARSGTEAAGGKPVSPKLQQFVRESVQIRHSYSYRLGRVLMDALLLRNKGRSTILLPYYLGLMVRDAASGRDRQQAKKELADLKQEF